MLRRATTVESEASAATAAATNDTIADDDVNVSVDAEGAAAAKSCGNVSQHDLSATLYGSPGQQKAEEDESIGGRIHLSIVLIQSIQFRYICF